MANCVVEPLHILEGDHVVKKTSIALLAALSLPWSAAQAQSAEPTLQGTWKYLRNFTFVQVDAQNRVYQCRIMPDLHVLFATGQIAASGAIQWTPVRFFSLYGKEFVPSGMDWGSGTIELRNRVMFLTAPTASGTSTERMEFDKVPELPTMCIHYQAIAFE
jgi:hypothetical protein